MSLIKCEVELSLAWSVNCVIISNNVANQNPTFTITETNLYVPLVTLSTQDNAKLLPQLKSGFKRKISWMKYLSKPKLLPQNLNLNHLIAPNLQGVNRLFVLAFEKGTQRTSNKRYYISNIEIRDYNVMIDGENFFNQTVKNDKVTYGNIRKIATGQRDYYTRLFIGLIYFKNCNKVVAIDLSKQQALDTDPKAIQQISFTANLDIAGNTMFCFTLKETKEIVFEFSKGAVKVL